MVRLRGFVLGFAVVVSGFAITCGGDVDVNSSGSGAAAGSGAGTGAQGGTSDVTGTSSTGSAMTTDVASSSSTGTPCSEEPCKLVAPQCGCGENEKCIIDTDVASRICAPDGTDPVGSACGDCVAGSQCIYLAGLGICKAFCDSDAQCEGPGGKCVLEIPDNMGAGFATLCTENCDPATNAGCTAAGSKCDLGQQMTGPMAYFTQCIGAGNGTQGAACSSTGDCAAGYGCFSTTSLQCLRFCTPNNPQCPAGTTCAIFNPPIMIGSVQYGACL